MSKFGMKVSVLQRSIERRLPKEYTHRSRVVLHIPLGDYGILAKILCKNISFIQKLKMQDLLKVELLKDARTIRTILEKSEKEVIK